MATAVAETGTLFEASSEAGAAAAATPSDADDAVAVGAAAAAAFGSGEGDTTKPSTLPPPEAGAAVAAWVVDAEKSAMLPIMYSDTARGSTEDAGSRMTASSAECAKALSTEWALRFPTAVAVLPAEEETPPMLLWPPEACRKSELAGSKACTNRFTAQRKG